MISQGVLQVRFHLLRQKYSAKAFWELYLLGNGMTKAQQTALLVHSRLAFRNWYELLLLRATVQKRACFSSRVGTFVCVPTRIFAALQRPRHPSHHLLLASLRLKNVNPKTQRRAIGPETSCDFCSVHV